MINCTANNNKRKLPVTFDNNNNENNQPGNKKIMLRIPKPSSVEHSFSSKIKIVVNKYVGLMPRYGRWQYTILNYLNLNDFHKLIFERCIKTMYDSTDQQLVKLRRVNKYFTEQVDRFIFEYINKEYQPKDFVPFSILGYGTKYFAPCLETSLNKALMLYFHAVKYPENKASKAFKDFFERQINSFLEGCSESNFRYIIDAADNDESSIAIPNLLMQSIKLNSQIPIEAYLISKFIERYIESEQFLVHLNLVSNHEIMMKLLQFLKVYQSFAGIDYIMGFLLSRIKWHIANSRSFSFQVQIQLIFLKTLLEKGLLTHFLTFPSNLNNFIHIGIENVKHASWAVQRDALVLFIFLLAQGIIIPKGFFEILLSLAIECIEHPEMQVQCNALAFLEHLVGQDVIVSKEILQQLILLAMEKISNTESSVQINAFRLLKELMSQGIAIPDEILVHEVSVRSLNSIYLIFKQCKPVDHIEIFLPLFFVLSKHSQGQIARIAKEIYVFLEKFQK